MPAANLWLRQAFALAVRPWDTLALTAVHHAATCLGLERLQGQPLQLQGSDKASAAQRPAAINVMASPACVPCRWRVWQQYAACDIHPLVCIYRQTCICTDMCRMQHTNKAVQQGQHLSCITNLQSLPGTLHSRQQQHQVTRDGSGKPCHVAGSQHNLQTQGISVHWHCLLIDSLHGSRLNRWLSKLLPSHHQVSEINWSVDQDKVSNHDMLANECDQGGWSAQGVAAADHLQAEIRLQVLCGWPSGVTTCQPDWLAPQHQ